MGMVVVTEQIGAEMMHSSSVFISNVFSDQSWQITTSIVGLKIHLLQT